MDIISLKNQIKTRTLQHYYIFTGDEWKVQQIYIQQMANSLNLSIVYIDQFKDIYKKLINKSFISSAKCYIVRDDADLISNEKLQSQISNILSDNILIHLITSIDKRTKFYKKYSDQIILFDRLSDVLLQKYIKKEVPLTDVNCNILMDLCEYNYGRILLELDKICRVGADPNKTFREFLKDGTIYEPPYDAVFDLVDAILDRKTNKVFNLLEQSYASGEATMVILSVLYNNAKAVLQVQTYEGDNLSQGTGLTGWQIKNAKAHINKYSTTELINILRLIHRVEKGIKNGRMEEQFAVQYLLCKIL